jgi:hypothetical protein
LIELLERLAGVGLSPLALARQRYRLKPRFRHLEENPLLAFTASGLGPMKTFIRVFAVFVRR